MLQCHETGAATLVFAFVPVPPLGMLVLCLTSVNVIEFNLRLARPRVLKEGHVSTTRR
jgi:hypothetical protein